MKKFILFLSVVALLATVNIYAIEKTDYFQLREKTSWHISFTENDGRMILHWDKLPYPCLYRVDTLSETTGAVAKELRYHTFDTSFTLNDYCAVSSTAIPMYYQITAYGLFGALTKPIAPVPNPNYPTPAAPVPIYHYTEENPASLRPYLVWHTVPAAVCYEVEFLSAPPEKENGTEISAFHHLFSTTQIYTNGWQADLSALDIQSPIYWRVRALDLYRQPIGVFSRAEPLIVDASLPSPDRPLLNYFDQMPEDDIPLYPVYQWIPMHGVNRYEVELLIKPPTTERGTLPSADRIWAMTVDDSFSCYDEYARSYAGPYYWRVRGIDEEGNTIGTYSDTARFIVPSRRGRAFAAAFGDSITHGGGALSYSPFNLEYNYTTYLDFPAQNLGRSGDTAHDSLLRFEADVLPYHPYNLLILTGSNDLRSDLSAVSIIKDLEGIREKCRANDIRPIFLTLMPINPDHINQAFHTETDPGWYDKMRLINAFIRQQEYYIDLEPYFYDPTHTLLDASLSIDGLHPDIRGKMLMAEIINAHKEKFRR